MTNIFVAATLYKQKWVDNTAYPNGELEYNIVPVLNRLSIDELQDIKKKLNICGYMDELYYKSVLQNLIDDYDGPFELEINEEEFDIYLLDYRMQYNNYHDHRFMNHIATLKEIDTFKIITFQEPNVIDTVIKFIFDSELSTLTITGGYGSIVATNVSNMGDIHKFKKDFVKNPHYFVTKVDSSSHDLMYYTEDSVKSYLLKEIFEFTDREIKSMLDTYNYEKYFNDKFEEYSDDMLSIFENIMDTFDESSKYGLDLSWSTVKTFDPYDILNIDEDEFIRKLYTIPKTMSMYVNLYLDAYHKAYDQLFTYK